MAGDPQSCQIDCSQRRQDAWQLLFKNRKKARNTTPQPATHEEGRVAGHTSCFIKAQHGAGEEKGAGSGTKLLPDSVMHVRSASLRHGHARLGKCMWE